MIRLVTGASWVDVEAILDHQVSDTTLRARRDEWIHAGVFEQLKAEALAAFDRIVGLDLDDVALDGSLHKAPYGGEEPAPIQRIGPSSAGSGRSPPSVTAYRWVGDRRRQPQRRRHLEPTIDAIDATGCSTRSGPCISTGAMTRARS